MKIRRKSDPKYVQICPECNSTDISTDHCKHKGTFFPEVLKSKIPKLIPLKNPENYKKPLKKLNK